MCGIVGMFSFSESATVGREEMARAMAALEHRGPDGCKSWISRSANVGLGHTRLSIIDLATGEQPLANEAGDVHLVANGEVYDFERIQHELGARGHRLRTKSDSEIILHLYEDYGADCLRFLRGEFAFVLWDQRNQTLFAARDRFGIKPLFYSRHAGKLYLASEAKALFAAGVPCEWDEETVFQSHYAPVLPHRTLFKNVFQVPAGHYLVVTRDQVREFPYWDFDIPRDEQSEQRDYSVDDHIGRVRAALEESIRLRLRADVPVGVYLSGGLDSSAIFGIASRLAPKPLKAFTLTFDQAEYDEAGIARETASTFGGELQEVPIRERDLADNYDAALWHGEFIPANSHSVAKFVLSRAVRNAGYKVVLTGEGSDEIFAGYPHFRKDLILSETRGKQPDEIRSRLEALSAVNRVSVGMLLAGGEHAELPFAQRTLGFTPAFLDTHAAAGAKLRSLYRPEFRERFADRDPIAFYLNAIDLESRLRGRHPVHQSMYLWAKTSLPNYLLSVLGDRMEMANSVEGRVPFLDHRLVELVNRIPLKLKIRGLSEKYILREAAKPFITETLYRRQKHPFLAPPVLTRTRGPMSDLLQDTLRGRQMQDQPFFDAKKVREFLDLLPSFAPEVRAAVDPGLMMILGIVRFPRRAPNVTEYQQLPPLSAERLTV